MSKILINSYACDPEKGSEYGLGWNWVSYIGRRYRTHLVTADRGRNEILLEALSSDDALAKNVTVDFIPWELPTDSVSHLLLRYYQPYYYRFYHQWMARSYVLAKEKISEGNVSLVHQNTYHSFREPGEFWKLGVPSVWAPVAGTTDIPFGFLSALGVVEGLRHAARNVTNYGHKRFNNRFRQAIHGYSKVVAGSNHAKTFFEQFRGDIEMIPGQLIRSLPSKHEKNIPHQPKALQLVFCGQHFSRKGGWFLIDAFARACQHANLHLHMIGQGVMTAKWRKLAEAQNCNSHITWHGMVSRTEVLEILKTCEVFVFPSLNDCYPTVIAEAFSQGLPVITTDIPGVGDMVDDHSGWKLHAGSPKQLIDELTQTLIRISKHPEEISQKRAGVLKRTEEFLFEDRMNRLMEIYEELLSGKPIPISNT